MMQMLGGTSVEFGSLSFFLLIALPIAATQLGIRGTAFSIILAAAGLVLAVSWISLPAAGLFVLALLPGWAFCRANWGRSERKDLSLLICLISLQISILVLTKLGAWSESLGIAGIVGLSYITFRQIHLMVSARRMPADEPFGTINWLGYLINPWMLLAGPIQTWQQYTAGLATLRPPNSDETLNAVHRILTGLLKILVFAPIFYGQSDIGTLTQPNATWRDSLVVFYSYYIFLYLDFSGYVDLIIGAAKLSGYRSVPENFNKPYFATNFQDFWGRWHITLGDWFRVYVFTPIQLAILRRWGTKYDVLAVSLSLMVVFMLIGIWHGTGWNYVMFGFFHASGVTVAYISRRVALSLFGKEKLGAYENNILLKPIRVLACQNFIAASFVLLDNDAGQVAAYLVSVVF